MRHRVSGKKLGRDTKHRKALWRNLMRQLVMHGHLETTEVKGKELKRVADRLVGQAQVNSIASRRLLHRFFGKRDVVNALVDQVAPTFTDRHSGFTRIERLGNRAGDNALLVRVSWVIETEVKGNLKNPNPQSQLTKATKHKPSTKSDKSVQRVVRAKQDTANKQPKSQTPKKGTKKK